MQTGTQIEKGVIKHLITASHALSDARKPMPFASVDAEKLDNIQQMVREVLEDIKADGIQ